MFASGSLRGVFRDEGKLDINYLPHILPHRNAELRLLQEFFSYVLRAPSEMSQRVIITGDVGAGKTALSQRFGDDIELEAQARHVNLRYVHVNCREYHGSLFLILHSVVSRFHENFPKRGYSDEELLVMLSQMMNEEKTALILTLDEFDSLIEREGSDGVYRITRFQESRPKNTQKLSLICVLRNLDLLRHLDDSTRSTLQSNIIMLKRYSKTQLSDILHDRVVLAFKPRSVQEESVNLIADLASAENGNARFGIELLWRAGKYANVDDGSCVTPEHVRKAVSSIVPGMRRSDLTSLSLHEKILLLGLSRLFLQNKRDYVSMSEAEQAYSIVCEELGVKANSHTMLWKYVQNLSALGVVKTEVKNAEFKGRTTRIYLPTIPARALEDELKLLLEQRRK